MPRPYAPDPKLAMLECRGKCRDVTEHYLVNVKYRCSVCRKDRPKPKDTCPMSEGKPGRRWPGGVGPNWGFGRKPSKNHP